MLKPLAAAAAALLASALWTCDVMADAAPTPPADLEAPPTRWGNLGAGVYYSGRPDLQVGLFAATIRNLRPIAGVTVAGSPGFSGTPSAQYAEMVIRYIW